MFLKDFSMIEKAVSAGDARYLSMNPEIVCLFEDVLRRGSFLRLKVYGGSMEPFLRGGEVLTVRKVPYHFLKRGDLILFRNSHGNAVIHRIIRKRKCGMVQTKGDAAISLDKPVREDEVLGKVCGIERASSHISMETWESGLSNYILAITQLIKYGIYHALSLFGSPLRRCP